MPQNVTDVISVPLPMKLPLTVTMLPPTRGPETGVTPEMLPPVPPANMILFNPAVLPMRVDVMRTEARLFIVVLAKRTVTELAVWASYIKENN